MLNLHSLFHSTVEQPTLLERLELTPMQRDFIAQAKTKVRNCLRERLPVVLQEHGYDGPIIRPRHPRLVGVQNA